MDIYGISYIRRKLIMKCGSLTIAIIFFFCTVVWINRKTHLIWIWFILYLLTKENILLRDHILCLYSCISFDSQVRTMENRIFVRSFLHDIPLCKLHTYWFVINDSFKRRINVLINWLECLKARVLFAFFSFKR